MRNRGIVGSYNIPTFTFLKFNHTDFHNGCTNTPGVLFLSNIIMAEIVTFNYSLTTLWEVEMRESPRVEVAAQRQNKRDPASKPV